MNDYNDGKVKAERKEMKPLFDWVCKCQKLVGKKILGGVKKITPAPPTESLFTPLGVRFKNYFQEGVG